MEKFFTVEKGIEVQQRQLKHWKLILKKSVYEWLRKEVMKTNHLAKDGYDICRGNSMDNLMSNYELMISKK